MHVCALQLPCSQRLADVLELTLRVLSCCSRTPLQYGTFSAEDACNFALNIYDGGDTLSIGEPPCRASCGQAREPALPPA